MLKTNSWERDSSKNKINIRHFISSYFLLCAVMISLLLGGMVVGQLFGGRFGNLGFYAIGAVIGVIMMTIIIIIQQMELAVTLLMAIRFYVDWYLGLGVVAQVVSIALLIVLYLSQTYHQTWVKPRPMWLWISFLVISIFPATHSSSLQDGIYYYSNVIFSALIMFWLGNLLARNVASVHKLFKLLSCLSTCLAIIAIIQTATGKLLFGTTNYDAYLNSISDYALNVNTDIHRVGSFFVNPNTSGSFLAMSLFISFSLFVISSSSLGKVVYLLQTLIICFALLFTYSANSWISACIGLVVFLAFVGSALYRVLLPMVIAGIVLVLIIFSPTQLNLLLQHALAPSELPLRIAAWQTGIQVIHAFPLTGLGLGRHVYITGAEPYRVISQYTPLDHPHNSFIELAALGGILVSILFTALLIFTFWQTLCNWYQSDSSARPLIAGGLASVIALTSFSISDAGWTLAPLLAMGWLIFGIISSPLLTREQEHQAPKEPQP